MNQHMKLYSYRIRELDAENRNLKSENETLKSGLSRSGPVQAKQEEIHNTRLQKQGIYHNKNNKHALRWFVDLESYIILNMKHNMNNRIEIKYNVM